MSPDQLEDDVTVDDPVEGSAEDQAAEESPPLNLEIEVKEPSACERHVTVTVPREDIDRYYSDAFSDLMGSATVPGFRAGRAPRKLVESRFRKDVTQQIKGSLLMDSMGQISDEGKFTAISEPNFDLDAVELPDEGPMTFEFDIEVRPEFELPDWKGLKVNRSVQEFTDADVDRQIEQILTRFGTLAPHDGKAAAGDYLTVNLVCRHDGNDVASAEEEQIRIRPVLSFRDGRLEKFDKLAKGAQTGDKLEAEVELTADAPNEELRGKKVAVELEVLEVKKLELPELTEEFLEEIGGFQTEDDLRKAVRADLERQLEYRQSQQIREQITAALIATADWELPPDMLKRQSARELERVVLELRRSGFSEAEIRARENDLRQNSAASTAKSLKEHFILERIAEDEDIDATSEDFEKEIMLISMQSGESPRRVRAQLEKRGMMDVLRNQIVERIVIDLVRDSAKFKDEPFVPEDIEVEAIDLAAGGGDRQADIPDAKPAPEEKPNPGTPLAKDER